MILDLQKTAEARLGWLPFPATKGLMPTVPYPPAMRNAVLAALFAVAVSLTSSATASSLGSPGTDLHRVAWKSVVVPAETCGASRPIRLHDGDAVVTSDQHWEPRRSRFPLRVEVHGWTEGVVYGDLDGDGKDEAALSVMCQAFRSTAAGQVRFTWVVFTPGAIGPRVLGMITSRQPRQERVSHVPLLGFPVTIWHGGVTVPEAWYGPSDSTAGPTGRAETIWRFTEGHVRPAKTIVFRAPSTNSTYPSFPDVRFLRDGSVVSVTRRGEVNTWDLQGRPDSLSWCATYTRYRQWVRFFSSFRTSVLTDDQARVATFLGFPLRWNHDRQTTVIRNAAEVLRRYRQVFTPSVVERIRRALTQAPFCRNVSMVMIGSGVVWASNESGQPLLFAVNG